MIQTVGFKLADWQKDACDRWEAGVGGIPYRGTLEISRPTLSRMLASPGVGAWWAREARRTFTPEFVRTVESLVSVEPPTDSDEDAA